MSILKLWNWITSALQKTWEETTLLDVSISKRGIAIQAAVAHNIEWRKDTKQLRMYMYIITEGKVCTRMKTHCNAFLACILAFYRNNVGRFLLLHTPIWVDVTICFQPISYVCSICMCQVTFELYHNIYKQHCSDTMLHLLMMDSRVNSCILVSNSTRTCKQVHEYPQTDSSPPASKFTCTHKHIHSYSWMHLPAITSEVTNKRFLWCVIVDSSRKGFRNTWV